jgi:hypothetical protein
MVVISMNQDINLVSKDYYKQEIEYEDQIQRIRNTQALEEAPEITLDRMGLSIIISFPEGLVSEDLNGYVHLFRPSDSSLDKKYRLELDGSGSQIISISGHLKGLWKVKLLWGSKGSEYYLEKIFTY